MIHGKSATKTYHSYAGMLGRCYNKNNHKYKDYGGRGIKVCKRWRGKSGFVNFLSDMGECPPDHSIDRYPDNNGNYSPSNCRWANARQQANNRRSNILISLNGKTKTATQWSNYLKLKPATVIMRYYRNPSISDLTKYLGQKLKEFQFAERL